MSNTASTPDGVRPEHRLLVANLKNDTLLATTIALGVTIGEQDEPTEEVLSLARAARDETLKRMQRP